MLWKILIGVLLSALVLASYFVVFGSCVEKKDITITKIDLSIFKQAMERYKLDVGRYPSESEGLLALVNKPSGVDSEKYPKDGYLRQNEFKDRWGTMYQYKVYKKYGSLDCHTIWSFGADGLPGGGGESQDIATVFGDKGCMANQ